MKRFLLATTLLFPLTLGAQNHHFEIRDTAAHTINTYLRMLNFQALPEDSILYMETSITSPGSTDTLTMRRWFARPQMHRVEVFRGKELLTGLCSNGSDRFREYFPRYQYWETVTPDKFHEDFSGYDFRGPLHNWNNNGYEVIWNGTTEYKGQPLQVVKVISFSGYDRYYMFDPANSLLTLIIEELTVNGDTVPTQPAHIDWKIIHEYTPIGESLIPTLESFMRGATLTIMATTCRFLPRNNLIFNRDQ